MPWYSRLRWSILSFLSHFSRMIRPASVSLALLLCASATVCVAATAIDPAILNVNCNRKYAEDPKAKGLCLWQQNEAAKALPQASSEVIEEAPQMALPACSRLDDRRAAGSCMAQEGKIMRGDATMESLYLLFPSLAPPKSAAVRSSASSAGSCPSVRTPRERARCRLEARRKK